LKSLAILDIDDTLFDWLSMWTTSFIGFRSALASACEQQLIEIDLRLRRAHKSVGTSEYPFKGMELNDLFPEIEVSKLSEISDQLQAARADGHKLYGGVSDSLLELRSTGFRIALHTDAPPLLAGYRVKKLGIAKFADGLYSTRSRVAKSLNEVPRGCECPHIVVQAKKPDPTALNQILTDFEVEAPDAVYVGDSLMRDVAMASDCNVVSVHASYGDNRDTQGYELLRAVSHWTDEDIEFERRLKDRGTVLPSAVVTSPGEIAKAVFHAKAGKSFT
jgi:phosphoglycolate phosphatase